jgi:ADP-heptose:LPS heptosyltransferase
MPRKILIIRFSSIGDIILITPLLRCLANQLPDAELQLVTRARFAAVVNTNPHLKKTHSFDKEVSEVYEALKAENFDLVIDLHHNLRSLRLKRTLSKPSFSFNKLNWRKFFAVYFKWRELLPPVHIVTRYFGAAKSLGVKEDHQGLELFINREDQINAADVFGNELPNGFIALVIGGSYTTKKIPIHKLKEIISFASLPVVLMGGPEDKALADQLTAEFAQIKNTCGHLRLMQSASLISQAAWVITSDTGLMHMAAAFNRRIVSVWGNTVPEFGMGPYLPHSENKLLEIKDLPCRPCSKLGYHQCPMGHFRCMHDLNFEFVHELK